MKKIYTLIVAPFLLTACLGGWVSRDENVYNNNNATHLLELNKARKAGTISEESYQAKKAIIMKNSSTNSN